MSVPNPAVRLNAVGLFVDAFPLQNPDSSAKEADTLLQKQFTQLQRLLEDEGALFGVFDIQNVEDHYVFFR